jgi:hypothetical protein
MRGTSTAGGSRIDYAVTDKMTLTYDNFIGNATADTVPVHLRLYHDLITQYNPTSRWQLATVILWRTEYRAYSSSAHVWPLNHLALFGHGDSFIVSSLALTF